MIDFSYDYESIEFKASTRDELLKLVEAIQDTGLYKIESHWVKKTSKVTGDPLALAALHPIAKAISELSYNVNFKNPKIDCFFNTDKELSIFSKDSSNLEILVEAMRNIAKIDEYRINDDGIEVVIEDLHPIVILILKQFIRIADVAF
jgi:hypothetical protein